MSDNSRWGAPLAVLAAFVVLEFAPALHAQPFDSPDNKVYSVILQTIERLQKDGITSSRPFLPEERQRYSSLLTPFDDRGRIGIILDVTTVTRMLSDRLAGLGADIQLVIPEAKTVALYAPFNSISEIAAMEDVLIVRPMTGGINNTGSVTSEGDSIHHAVNVRNDLDVEGDSINVGVISDGCTSWMASSASGDLPATFGSPNFTFANGVKSGSGDEGTAMMEIVYDLAPKADLFYYGALGLPGGSATMVDAIQRLVREKKCRVIVDDVTYFDQPMFEDGTPATAWTIAAAAKWAIDTGVVYVTSAGNYAAGGATDRSHYQATFNDIQPLSNTPGPKPLPNGPIPVPPPPPPAPNSFDDIHDFDPGPGFDPGLMVVIPRYNGIGEPPKLYVILQWNDPWGLSADDYDLYLYDARMVTLLTSSVGVQAGAQNPYESVWYYNYGATPETVNVVINHFAPPGGPPKLLGLYISGCSYVERHTAENSIWGQPGVPDVISVGAVPANNITVIENFSSRGNYDVYFPLFQSREKPDVVAVDGVSITNAGGFPAGGGPFFGTSASAPHVAGMAALLLSRCPTMTPASVHTKFERTAVDLGIPGFDPTFGKGRADIERAMLELDVAIGSHGPYTMNTSPGVPSFFCTPDAYALNTVTITGGLWGPSSVTSSVTVTAGNPYAGAGVMDPGCPTLKRWYQLTQVGGIIGMYTADVTAYVDDAECIAAGVNPANLAIIHWNGSFFDRLPVAGTIAEVRSTWKIRGSLSKGDFSPFFVGVLTRGLDASTVANNSGKNDSTVGVQFSVQNTGNGWDTLAVHLGDTRGWTLSPADTALSLTAGQKVTMTIRVHISATDPVGTIDTIRAKAVSVSESGVLDSTMATVTIIKDTEDIVCAVNDGWNILSVPLHVADSRKTTIIPTAVSSAYTYRIGYFASDTLWHCVGYWAKFNGAQNVTITGTHCHAETMAVVKGWNMIGSVGGDVPVSGITSIPGGITTSNFYGYSTSYFSADTIKPGYGYWVKVSQAGKLFLSSSVMEPSAGRIRIVDTGELPPLPPAGSMVNQGKCPTEYVLHQNYPNPFNPATTIGYELPAASRVMLSVHDVLGRQIRTILNEYQEAGYKSVRFDAGDLPSGIYFYRIVADKFSKLMKMTLLK